MEVELAVGIPDKDDVVSSSADTIKESSNVRVLPISDTDNAVRKTPTECIDTNIVPELESMDTTTMMPDDDDALPPAVVTYNTESAATELRDLKLLVPSASSDLAESEANATPAEGDTEATLVLSVECPQSDCASTSKDVSDSVDRTSIENIAEVPDDGPKDDLADKPKQDDDSLNKDPQASCGDSAQLVIEDRNDDVSNASDVSVEIIDKNIIETDNTPMEVDPLDSNLNCVSGPDPSIQPDADSKSTAASTDLPEAVIATSSEDPEQVKTTVSTDNTVIIPVTAQNVNKDNINDTETTITDVVVAKPEENACETAPPPSDTAVDDEPVCSEADFKDNQATTGQSSATDEVLTHSPPPVESKSSDAKQAEFDGEKCDEDNDKEVACKTPLRQDEVVKEEEDILLVPKKEIDYEYDLYPEESIAHPDAAADVADDDQEAPMALSAIKEDLMSDSSGGAGTCGGSSKRKGGSSSDGDEHDDAISGGGAKKLRTDNDNMVDELLMGAAAVGATRVQQQAGRGGGVDVCGSGGEDSRSAADDQPESDFEMRDALMQGCLEQLESKSLENITKSSNQVVLEIRKLEELIRAKEREWNQLLHIKKFKEELLSRLRRSKQVFMIKNGLIAADNCLTRRNKTSVANCKSVVETENDKHDAGSGEARSSVEGKRKPARRPSTRSTTSSGRPSGASGTSQPASSPLSSSAATAALNSGQYYAYPSQSTSPKHHHITSTGDSGSSSSRAQRQHQLHQQRRKQQTTSGLLQPYSYHHHIFPALSQAKLEAEQQQLQYGGTISDDNEAASGGGGSSMVSNVARSRIRPVVDVQKMIANYRHTHPDVNSIPRRGRRPRHVAAENGGQQQRGSGAAASAGISTRSSTAEQRLQESASSAAGALGNGSPTSGAIPIPAEVYSEFRTLLSTMDAESLKNASHATITELLDQFTKMTPAERQKLISTVKPATHVPAATSTTGSASVKSYPEVTVHPVPNSSVVPLNNSSSSNSSLLHNILTKASSKSDTKLTFSPTLARLLTVPERASSSTNAASYPETNVTQNHATANYDVSLSEILSGNKNRNEITITPVTTQQRVVQAEEDDSVDRLVIDEGADEPIKGAPTAGSGGCGLATESGTECVGGAEEVPQCQGCQQRAAQFVCAGCGNQWYCSRECQVMAWDEHSDVCSG